MSVFSDKWLQTLLAIVFVALNLLLDESNRPQQPTTPESRSQERSPSIPDIEHPENLQREIFDPKIGTIEILSSHERLNHTMQRGILRKHEPAKSTITFSSFGNKQISFVAAPAVNNHFYPPNGFLIGSVPFLATQNWIPLYSVAEHMRYRYDHEQFPGRDEVWLTTMQAWNGSQGDCEDHAILLADWLIEMGLDARVVIGTHREGGHAWVIVFAEGKEYLLEATDKTRVRRWSAYPLALALPDYHPSIMFNRHLLWVNTGSPLTVSYSGKHWAPTYRFFPG